MQFFFKNLTVLLLKWILAYPSISYTYDGITRDVPIMSEVVLRYSIQTSLQCLVRKNKFQVGYNRDFSDKVRPKGTNFRLDITIMIFLILCRTGKKWIRRNAYEHHFNVGLHRNYFKLKHSNECTTWWAEKTTLS